MDVVNLGKAALVYGKRMIILRLRKAVALFSVASRRRRILWRNF
jgi:hypothetical protein